MIFFSKKAQVNDWYTDGPEYISLLLLAIGIILGIVINSKILSIIIIFLFGLLLGRVLYLYHGKKKFILMFTNIGFFLGYVIGSHYINWKILLIFFVGGAVLSYQAHKHGWITNV